MPAFRVHTRLSLLALFVAALAVAQRPTSAGAKSRVSYDPALVSKGKSIFSEHCGFCHGRDAMGGESGPNLTRSAVVLSDKNGEKIGEVVHNGRPGGMPKFNLPDSDIQAIAAFLHIQAASADSEEAQRRRITLQDLLTGNAEAGKQFFNGAGHCSECHSATGDLAGIASRTQPIPLELAMLHPRHVESTATVTTGSGETLTGTLEHLDEFTVSIRDKDGWQRSWPRNDVKVVVHNPAQAHLDLLPKYTDTEIHNVFAYLETLR